MKVHLMHPSSAFDPEGRRLDHAEALTADLGLDVLVSTMAGRDTYLSDIARAALLQPLADPAAIGFRQDVLSDCLRRPELARRLYAIATEASAVERSNSVGWHSSRPRGRVARARALLLDYVGLLEKLREEADAHGEDVGSAGLQALFSSIRSELDDDFLGQVDRCLDLLDFRNGLEETARLGTANEGTDFVLRVPERRGLRYAVSSTLGPHTVSVGARDLAGGEALRELQELGCVRAADALGRAVVHVKGFFESLRCEIGFHVAALNLHDALAGAGCPLCMPRPSSARGVRATGLCNPLLPLRGERPVANDLDADEATVVVVTGANQGGKSTFLRALGIAQLMMQAGLFVTATDFSSRPAASVFTHFRRREDDTMVHGKLDEELARLSEIIDCATPGSMILFNESFASTNERDASVIAGDVVSGLVGAGIRTHVVTHQFELAAQLRAQVPTAVFLRAERLADGTRSHRLEPGPPQPSSFGLDLYAEIFDERAPTMPDQAVSRSARSVT